MKYPGWGWPGTTAMTTDIPARGGSQSRKILRFGVLLLLGGVLLLIVISVAEPRSYKVQFIPIGRFDDGSIEAFIGEDHAKFEHQQYDQPPPGFVSAKARVSKLTGKPIAYEARAEQLNFDELGQLPVPTPTTTNEGLRTVWLHGARIGWILPRRPFLSVGIQIRPDEEPGSGVISVAKSAGLARPVLYFPRPTNEGRLHR